MEANECKTQWAHRSQAVLHMSESIQKLGGGELLEDSCEELKIASALSLIREQLKILGEKVNTLEEQFKKQLFPEEPEEPEAPEDLLTMLPL